MAGRKKTLGEMLVEHMATADADMVVRNHAVVVEYWNQIQEAKEEGWDYKLIWNALHAEGLFTFSYATFANYVRKRKEKEREAEAEKVEERRRELYKNRDTDSGIAGNPSPTKVDLPIFGSKRRPGKPPKF